MEPRTKRLDAVLLVQRLLAIAALIGVWQLAILSGTICDGAKPSCAAKIASALDASMLAHSLAMQGKVYDANTGILQSDTGKTITSVGHIGRIGMKQTDSEIVKIMIQS